MNTEATAKYVELLLTRKAPLITKARNCLSAQSQIRVRNLSAAGKSIAQIARELSVSKSSIQRVLAEGERGAANETLEETAARLEKRLVAAEFIKACSE